MSTEHDETPADPTGYETIAVDDNAGVRTVTLNRPEAMNAANQAMLAELSSAFDAAADL